MATCDPKLLPGQATCFRCAEPGTLKQIQLYLLSALGGVSSPGALSAGSATYRPFTNKFALAAQVYLLAVINGQSTNPQTLEKAAACWFCIPVSERLNVETYLLAIAAGKSTDPKVLARSVGPYRPLMPIEDQVKIFILNKLAGTLSIKAIENGAACLMCLDHRRLQEIYLFQLCAFMVASPMNPTIADVTGFAYVPDPAGVNSVASWTAPPAGVTKTEVWQSNNGAAFALAASVAAPGTTRTIPVGAIGIGDTIAIKVRYCNLASCGAFTAVQTVYGAAVDWLNRVQGNGGAIVAQLTATAMNTYYGALVAGGTVIAKIKALLMIVPDSIIAASTPLIKAAGSDPWVFNGGINFDLTVNGLRNTALNQFWNTGIIPSAVFASDTNGGIGCYVHTTHPADGGNDVDMGSNVNAAQACQLYTNSNSIFSAGDIYATGAAGMSSLTIGAGFWSINAIDVNTGVMYFGNSTTPFADIGHVGGPGEPATITGTRPNIALYAMALNQGGVTVGSNTVRRWSMFIVNDGFLAAEAQVVFNATQACRVTLGGGFV